MHWYLLFLLSAIAIGDLVRNHGDVTVALWCGLIFLTSAIAAGKLARARGRSVPAWVGWSTIFGPLPLILLLALGRKRMKRPLSS